MASRKRKSSSLPRYRLGDQRHVIAQAVNAANRLDRDVRVVELAINDGVGRTDQELEDHIANTTGIRPSSLTNVQQCRRYLEDRGVVEKVFVNNVRLTRLTRDRGKAGVYRLAKDPLAVWANKKGQGDHVSCHDAYEAWEFASAYDKTLGPFQVTDWAKVSGYLTLWGPEGLIYGTDMDLIQLYGSDYLGIP